MKVGSFLKKWWKQLRCKHEPEHVRNIHGDQIIHMGWNRSIWKCPKCDRVEYRKHLHPIPQHPSQPQQSTEERTRENAPSLDKIKTVNSDENDRLLGYELTLPEAIEMAYKAQDIHHALSVEHSRLLNGGTAMIGPSGRRGFNNMKTVLAYMQDTEQAINRLRIDIKALKSEDANSVTKAIKECLNRITVKDEYEH